MKKTERCEAIVARDAKVLAPTTHLSYYPLAIEKAQGAILTDADGNEYIDFLAAASSLNIGSCHPVVTKALQDQLTRGTQFGNVYTYNETSVAYAEKLTSVFPGGVKAKIAFGNCGSDANDCAVKFARVYTGRPNIIVFQNGYHGNTYGSSSMTTCSSKMHEKMGPFLPGIHTFPFFGYDLDDKYVEENCTKQLEEAFATYLPASEVAAVAIELIQGDAGILPAHPIFIKKLYDLCKKHGILFYAEEVQQAFYRTGKFFSVEHYGVIPDGIIMGKSIGATLTLGGFMARAEIMDSLPAPAHLFTFGGNVLACAAGCAQFDYFQSDEFQKHLASNIELIWKLAKDLEEKHPETVKTCRGIGMSMGIVLKDYNGVPANDVCYKTLYRAYEKGLLVISLGGNVLRIQPPLVIKPEELSRGFEIISESLYDLEQGKISDECFKYRKGW